MLAADEAVAEGYRYGTYVAVCGELVERSSLARADCDDDCECKGVAYCLACLRAANKRAWEAGVDVDCPPGVFVR